jgi:hypothetical protein
VRERVITKLQIKFVNGERDGVYIVGATNATLQIRLTLRTDNNTFAGCSKEAHS